MAMTKETCIAEGEQLFRQGAERPEGSSWQAKAKQQGWDDEEARFGADMREDHVMPNEHWPVEIERIVSVDLNVGGDPNLISVGYEYRKSTVEIGCRAHHIQLLITDEANEENRDRKIRLRRKIAILRERNRIWV